LRLKIIVIGVGDVGFEIAFRLSREGHDIIVIDKDAEALREIGERLDIMTLYGNGASTAVLDEAGADRAGILVAVTDVDEVNMIACMTGKQYGVPVCVARIRNPEYTVDTSHSLSLQRLGIDLIINPERLAAQEILRLLAVPAASDIEYFADGRVFMLGLKVDEQSPIVGRALAECSLPDCLLVAVDRGDELEIPRGDSVVRAEDRVFIVGRTKDFREIRAFIGPPVQQIKTVGIVGGSRIGQYLVDMLVSKRRPSLSVALFEKDAPVAERLAKHLPQLLVIHGDATKIDVLRDEGASTLDAFVTVAGEDHTNLLATMLLKELGVSEVITKISREDYAPLATKAGADAVVVPRLLMVSSVLRLVRECEIISMTLLQGGAETLEFCVTEGCRIANRRLREVDFPKKALVGAIVRSGDVIIPNGESRVLSGDRVIVFSAADAVDDVAVFFQGRKNVDSRKQGFEGSFCT
jgi:trk system potassium uptake protein TrkA